MTPDKSDTDTVTETTGREEWPDYTPLYDVVIDANGMLALDFSARVGARPYITYEDGDWRAVSVGPFDNTDDGKTVITTKEFDVNDDGVMDMLDGARLVQLRSTQDTPLDGFDDWVYQGLGEGQTTVDEYEADADTDSDADSDTDTVNEEDTSQGDPRCTTQPRPCGTVHPLPCGLDVECPVITKYFDVSKTSKEIVEASNHDLAYANDNA